MNRYTENALAFNEQLSLRNISFAHTEHLRDYGYPDAIIVVGMGGSGLVANLLQNLASHVNINIPIIPWKNFGLPHLPYFKNPFYVFVSFSGDTKETLSGFKVALKQPVQPHIAVVSGGGALLREAEENRIPRAIFPQGDCAPRQATGAMLYSTLGILKEMLLDVSAPDLREEIDPKKFLKESKDLAKKIGKKNIVVYGTESTNAVAYFWKAHLNEAGKAMAFTNSIPEIDHNEMVGFESKPKDTIALFVEDGNESAEVKKLIPIIIQSLKKFSVPSVRVKLKGANALEQTMNGLVLGSLIGIAVAEYKKIDPSITEIITYLKKRM